jgi:hypothetical protein
VLEEEEDRGLDYHTDTEVDPPPGPAASEPCPAAAFLVAASAVGGFFASATAARPVAESLGGVGVDDSRQPLGASRAPAELVAGGGGAERAEMSTATHTLTIPNWAPPLANQPLGPVRRMQDGDRRGEPARGGDRRDERGPPMPYSDPERRRDYARESPRRSG